MQTSWSHRAATNGILFKGGDALEITHKAKHIVLDKTGTITKGEPEVVDIVTFNKTNQSNLLKIAASIEKVSEHPLAEAVVNKYASNDFFEISEFNSITGHGVAAQINGEKYFIGNRKLLKDNMINLDNFENNILNFENEGKSVMLLANNSKPLGLLTIKDNPKESSFEAIAKMKDLEMEVHMITGDNKTTAKAIATQVGVDNIFSEVLPEDKSKYIEKLSQEGTVIMVGDGINDAPALALADVGIAHEKL